MGTVKTIELYNLLKDKLGDKESRALIEVIEEIAEKAKGEVATKVDLAETKVEIIKWVAGMLIIQAGILIGGFFAIVKFLLK